MLFELAFIVVCLGSAAATVWAGLLTLRRRRPQARRVLGRTASFLSAYVAVILLASVAAPRQWIALGQEQRFDDWAVTVRAVARSDQHYRVDLRVSSHARRRPQRAVDADVRLVAADGRSFAPQEAPGERSLQSVLQPGETFDTVRTFDVPPDADVIGLDVIHGGWPGLFVIADRGSLLHKRPLVRLDAGKLGHR